MSTLPGWSRAFECASCSVDGLTGSRVSLSSGVTPEGSRIALNSLVLCGMAATKGDTVQLAGGLALISAHFVIVSSRSVWVAIGVCADGCAA